MPDKLPKGWIRLTMGDVGRWFGGGTPSKANSRFWIGGNIPWVSPKDMKSDFITDTQDHITEEAVEQSATNLVDAGSVLIVVRSGILQHTLPVAVAQRQVALNQDIKAIKPLAIIRSEYLALALKAFEQDILHNCTKTGTTVQSLELPAFLRFSIPVAPLPEQQRIVAKLDAMLSRVSVGETAARRALTRLDRYRAAVLHAAVTGELTRDWRKTHQPEETGAQLLKRLLVKCRARWEKTELKRLHTAGKSPKDDKWKKRYPAPAPVHAESLSSLPEGWVWASLDQLGELSRGKSKHRPRDDARLYGGPYPFIQTGDVRKSEGTIREHHQTYSEFGLKQSLLWPAGTLCITIAANIAETGILTYPACFPDSVVGFVQDETYLNVRFVEFFIRSEKAKLEKYAPATAQKNINLELLQGLSIPLPPLEEQRQLVRKAQSRLTAAKKLSDTLSSQLERARATRQSLLHEAFSGNLVPQDSNDEPASTLFERIHSCREAEPKKLQKMRTSLYPRVKSPRVRPKRLAADEGSESPAVIVPVFNEATSPSPRRVTLTHLKLYDDFNSLKAAEFPLRSFETKSERLSPLCLVGLNGSGKSNLIEALSEIFCHVELSLLPWKAITGKQRIVELRFDLEYHLLASSTAKPTTVRLEKPSSQPVVFKVIRDGKEIIITDAKQCLDLLPTRILGYSSGLNETISIPYFRTAAIYSQEVLKQARREKANPDMKVDDVPDSKTFFMDYECNALILVSNFQLQPKARLGLFRRSLRIDSLHSFDIRYRSTYQGNKKVELTRELSGYLDAIRSCASSVERAGDTEVFRFTNPKVAAPKLKRAFTTALHFFRALYKLSLLNPLALTGRKRKFFLREDTRTGQLERPPTISREDRIFSVENIRVNLTKPKRPIDYAAISDGEHQFLQIFGSVTLFDEPGCVFLLDEPETHFNPHWRRLCIQWLADMKKTQRQELLISTHSPFVVSGCHKKHVFKFVRDGGHCVCSTVSEETFGASYDYLLARLFSMETMIAGEAIEAMREVVKSTSVEKLHQAIPMFGESLEKRFIFERISRLEAQKKKKRKK